MPLPRLIAPPPRLVGGLNGRAAAASSSTPPDLALLALELGDREVDRVRYGVIQSREQSERPQQLDHRRHLNRIPPLCALHGRLTNPGLGSHLGLSPVAFEAVTLQPAAKLSENGSVGGEFIEMHRF
jgi:hypothetical protein